MLELEQYFASLFEEYLGIYTNINDVCLSIAEGSITASASLQDSPTEYALNVATESASIIDFITMHKLENEDDIDLIDRQMLWELFEIGQGQVYCNINENIMWFQRRPSNEEKANNLTLLIEFEDETTEVCHEKLIHPNDFLGFAIRRFNGHINPLKSI